MLENAVTRGHRNGHPEGGFQFGGYHRVRSRRQHLVTLLVGGDERPRRASPLLSLCFSHYSALPHEPFRETDGQFTPAPNQAAG